MRDNSAKRINQTNEMLESKFFQNDTTKTLSLAREKARERFRILGVPMAKDEYWKFSSPQNFTTLELAEEKHKGEAALSVDLKSKDLNVFFVDGVLDEELSDLDSSRPNLEIVRITDEKLTDAPWIENLYGELEAASQNTIKRPLAALNTACASDGVFIRVKRGKHAKIFIHYIRKKSHSDLMLHNLVKLEEESSLTLIEKGEGATRLNRVTEIDLLPNANLNHVRFFGDDVSANVLSQIFVKQDYKSHYNEFSVIIYNEFIRNEFYVSLEGKQSKVSLSGANLGNQNNVQDDTIFIAHLKRDCESRQVFKKVLKDNSTGIFQGKIYVTAEAQQTDGYQISKGLLIGADSKFLTKPELEIYADDVVCSHGSTCGAIDEDSLFYLTSRGVSRQKAISMLILAFLDEAVQEIENDELSDEIRNILRQESEALSD